ncbi:MAG: EAL domain-containing protein [Proteobacteria bacterium]|nr:EAL domain-containing protein [Pseudomonadota bacterium]
MTVLLIAFISMGIALQLTMRAQELLLEKEGAKNALQWIQSLERHYGFTSQIFTGQDPGRVKTLAEKIRTYNDVFHYEFYSLDGKRILSGSKFAKALNPRNDERRNQEIIRERGTHVGHGNGSTLPKLYTVTNVPMMDGSRFVGTIRIYSDQTERAAIYKQAFGFLTAGLLIVMAFGSTFAGSMIAKKIKAHQKVENEVRYLAHHDSLTGLMNRETFSDTLVDALKAAKSRSGVASHTGILWIDLDYFKEVNDTHGHATGDALLKKVTLTLLESVGEGETVARVGGDEFAILCRPARTKNEMKQLAESLCGKLNTFVNIDDRYIPCGACIGIAVAPSDGETAAELIKSADLAMYNAKVEGRHGYRFYDAGMHEKVRQRRELEQDLEHALQNSELEVHYQPQVTLETGKIESYEALVRWNHPTKGQIQPADFIPVAEETGLIDLLGEQVLQQACKDAAGWAGGERVAVNLSPAQFKNDRVLKVVSDALSGSGLEPERLELEITESLLFNDPQHALACLTALKNMGVRIAMDDFGTGYSSLGHLWRFPFDKIKIDQTFIKNMDNNPKIRTIILSILDLGRALDISITAEGIEEPSQENFLRENNCEYVQGFLYGRPKPNSELDSAKDQAQTARTGTPTARLLQTLREVGASSNLSPEASTQILKALVKLADAHGEGQKVEPQAAAEKKQTSAA